MSRFSSPQIRTFEWELTEPTSPLKVVARREGETFAYHFSDQEWSFLNELINSGIEFPITQQSHRAKYWKEVLEYQEDDTIDWVQPPEPYPALPQEIFELWPSNTVFEYEIWERERLKYEPWLTLVNQLESGLPEAQAWTEQTPTDHQLKNLEFELAHSLPNRSRVLHSMHTLGLLEADDSGHRDHRLQRLGCQRLRAWRKASLTHRRVSPFIDGMWPEGANSVLSSPVGLEWFLEGPYQQKYLDPLHHLKFALQQHLKALPSQKASSFVVSMGGRISGAFFYELGPGGIPQLVRGGEPPKHSYLYPLYQHQLSSPGNRIAELAARACRLGFPSWAGRLALRGLELDESCGQLWIELGVALFRLQHPNIAKACLLQAESLKHSFHKGGELKEVWSQTASTLPAQGELLALTRSWEEDLKTMPTEEQVAHSLMPELALSHLEHC